MQQKIFSHSEQETEAAGAAAAALSRPGTVITLNGDLGAGKTVFARGFARKLGITEPVSSPTYTIVQEYNLPGGGRLYHLDLYRISSPEAGLAFGVDEFLSDPEAITLVEWPERLGKLVPPGAGEVTISHAGESLREITLNLPEKP